MFTTSNLTQFTTARNAAESISPQRALRVRNVKLDTLLNNADV